MLHKASERPKCPKTLQKEQQDKVNKAKPMLE